METLFMWKQTNGSITDEDLIQLHDECFEQNSANWKHVNDWRSTKSEEDFLEKCLFFCTGLSDERSPFCVAQHARYLLREACHIPSPNKRPSYHPTSLDQDGWKKGLDLLDVIFNKELGLGLVQPDEPLSDVGPAHILVHRFSAALTCCGKENHSETEKLQGNKNYLIDLAEKCFKIALLALPYDCEAHHNLSKIH
jgi:hypothetical protein